MHSIQVVRKPSTLFSKLQVIVADRTPSQTHTAAKRLCGRLKDKLPKDAMVWAPGASTFDETQRRYVSKFEVSYSGTDQERVLQVLSDLTGLELQGDL